MQAPVLVSRYPPDERRALSAAVPLAPCVPEPGTALADGVPLHALHTQQPHAPLPPCVVAHCAPTLHALPARAPLALRTGGAYPLHPCWRADCSASDPHYIRGRMSLHRLPHRFP